MIRLIQRRLIIPRGDTGTFSVPVLSSYNSGDVAVFSIINPITQSKIYEKIVEVTESVITIKFEHGDTVNLPVGKYLWDIKFYQNPVIVDGELVNGTEIDSYYAAFTMPVCEIRQTGDNLMTADDAPGSTLTPQQLNAINAALLALKDAVEKTEANVEHYPTIIDGVWNVWDANLGDYTSTGIEATGNGIASIEKTNTEGLVDTYTVNFTDGTTFIYNVTNGSSIGSITKQGTSGLVDTYVIAYTNGDSTTFTVTNGATPDISIGEVREGPVAAASITGTAANPVLNLTLPNANVPTKVSELENDSGYLTQETDPTVPAWAKEPTKPSYTSQEVGALPADTYIPQKTSDLTNDSDYAVDANYVHTDNNYTNEEKEKLANVAAGAQVNVNADWNATSGDAQILNKPTNVSEFTNDAGYLTEHQDISGKADKSEIPTQVSQLENDSGYLTSFTETDPTVPEWAKQPTKPTYTAAEVGAPTVTEMNTAIGEAIGQINSFDIAVVQALPTQDISTHTIYLVPKTGETNDVYDEYIYINSKWEMVGNTQIDLSDYALKSELPTKVSDLTDDSGHYTKPATGIPANDLADGVVPVQDVQVNGASVLNNGIANIDAVMVPGTGVGSAKTRDFENSGTTYSNIASGVGAFAGGNKTEAIGMFAHTEGRQTQAKGAFSHAEGYLTIASNAITHAEGMSTRAGGTYGAHAEGYITYSNGATSHTEGMYTLASKGDSVHAEGYGTFAEGHFSHSEGDGFVGACKITGEANSTIYSYSYLDENEFVLPISAIIFLSSNGKYSRIESVDTQNKTITLLKTFSDELNGAQAYIVDSIASGVAAHAEGRHTIASGNSQRVSGKYNVADDQSIYANIIGNGSNADARSNAFALDWSGNGHYMGDVYVGANADSTGGTKVLCEADFATAQDIQNIINGGAGA